MKGMGRRGGEVVPRCLPRHGSCGEMESEGSWKGEDGGWDVWDEGEYRSQGQAG